jgi:hypothetical protein
MRCSRHPLLIAMLVIPVAMPPRAMADSPSGAKPPISFNEHVRPILSEKCFACHGPDSANRQAGLRLDLFDAATAELESGLRAIIPEDIVASELIARVTSDDPDVVMPPPAAKIGQLAPEEVATLKRWIAEGATYEPHWAFIPPKRPEVDDAVAGIDAIVSEKLAARGLAHQPEADRITLIRRASFDVTGLPPTPEEIRAFVADTSSDAYEKLLDRLLASPRYGERMAADWLDIARYSDSYGFQVDRPRPTMWPWRDWVIKSFNVNLPWDQFVTWQVAGDLLPDVTDEQILATAFNRLHQQEAEGGSVEEEYRVAYVNDRVTTFGTAFLGLTLECCRCHDHKFDPLPQKEFYSLFAFFDDVDEAGLYSFFTDATPTPKLSLSTPTGKTSMAEARMAVIRALVTLSQTEAAVRNRIMTATSSESPPLDLGPEAAPIPGELAHYPFEERLAKGHYANAVPDAGPASSPPDNVLVPGRSGQAIKLTGDHPVTTPIGNFRRSHPFTVSLWLRAPVRSERAVIFHRSRAWTDAASRGYELIVDEGHLRWSLIHFWPGDAVSVRMMGPLPVGTWTHVAVTSDGSGEASGLKVSVNGRPAATTTIRDCLTREITGGGGDTITIGERFRDHGFKDGLIDEFRVFDRQLTPLEVRELAEPGAITAAMTASKDDATAIAAVADVAAARDDAVIAARKAVEEARRTLNDVREKFPEIMVMRELAEPKTAYVLERGDYDKRGDVVEPGTPAVLPPFPTGFPRNRLGLAKWLVDPEHPLLPRVTVNRVWQSIFGLGIVQSSEDLGSQSTKAEYPEVLDLLAWKFSHPVTEGGFGWDVKRLVKTILLSQTYRQRSIADAKTMADDPLNVWLARGPRHRLPAEMIRDGALAACGLLVEKVGGPPVKTYDMPDSFKPEKAGKGDDLYRRSLYTSWRRTGPAPMLEAFDMPNRVVCVARRDTTNTPLHAFVVMNGTQFVEAARVLAERLLSKDAATRDTVLSTAFERLTSREPDETELKLLRDMHAGQLAWYTAHPDDAARFVSIGQQPRDETLPAAEVAAMTAVINALLDYDGTVVKQ